MADFLALLENSLIIHRCTIFKWEEYRFQDTGEIKDKYWITLNCKLNEFPINVILPTSQWDNHCYSKKNHMIDCVIIERGESKYFNAEKTILDLKNIISEEEHKVREAFEDGFLCELGSLENNLVERLEKAINDSETLEPFFIDELLCKKQ